MYQRTFDFDDIIQNAKSNFFQWNEGDLSQILLTGNKHSKKISGYGTQEKIRYSLRSE